MIKQSIDNIREQLGWQGMAGIALLLLAAMFQNMALDRLERETSYLRNRLEMAHSKAAMQGGDFTSGSKQRELGAFFDSLPEENDITDILAKIYSSAERSGVLLKEASYHLDASSNPRVEYSISFPVSGEYSGIRTFVFKVLADHPAIALDQINFQRDRVNDATLKAEIRFTLFIRPNR